MQIYSKKQPHHLSNDNIMTLKARRERQEFYTEALWFEHWNIRSVKRRINSLQHFQVGLLLVLLKVTATEDASGSLFIHSVCSGESRQKRHLVASLIGVNLRFSLLYREAQRIEKGSYIWNQSKHRWCHHSVATCLKNLNTNGFAAEHT